MGRGKASQVRRWALALLAMGLAVTLGVWAASLYVEKRYADRILPRAEAPQKPVAIVYGAGLAPGGVPSPVLAQRLDAAIALYREGKVDTLLLSGDNSDRFHDETRAMLHYVLERGIPASAVQEDDAGLSTYDSSVRAHTVFGVREAVLVTQRFHLTRALYIANSVGIDAWGVAADEGRPRTRRYALRETLSRVLALCMVMAGAEPRYPSGRTLAGSR
ncbi:SanA/YdcF family protein [Archangium lipolyticum]|uniref:SanA/YdcF family protein n=1 Tax=Archangium lipolyticum TaxID=2970465 RepID=UPI00214A88BD|nr:ElyC/SanA/YdcF family protein [Archangium lipolyticum]